MTNARNLANRSTDFVSVRDYGARGDGVTSDRDAINAAIAAAQAAGGGEVYFPEGTYLITGGITGGWTGNSDRDGLLITGNNITLVGTGPGTILKQDSTNQNLLALDGTAAQIAHITIRNIRFDGPTARHVMTSTSDIYQRIHLIKAVNVFNVNIADCVFYAFQGDGIDFDGGFHGEGAPPYATTRHNVNLYIDNCIFDGFDNNNRNGVSVIDGDNVFVSNNTFRRIAKQYMPGSFDIEPNPYPYYITRNIYVTNNSFNNCQGSNGHLGYFIPSSSYPVTDPPENFVFSGNTFTGTGTGIYGNCRDDINLGVLISNNVYRGSNRPFLFGYNSGAISYINGVTIDGNNFYYTTSSGVPFLGYKDAHEDVVKNVVFSNNIVASNATGPGMRLGGSLDNVLVSGNIFNNVLDYGVLTGATSGSVVAYIRSVSFVGNKFPVIAGTGFSVSTQLNTNPDASGCAWYSNTAAGNGNVCRFPAGQFLDYHTASPTAGRYAVGAVVKNLSATVGQPKGWVCTVAGQPGTWVSEGNL